MATQEVVLRFRGDPSLLKGALSELRAAHGSTMAEITRQARQEAQAAAALQRQRSSAIITVWKADTRAAANEERQRMQAAISLQRQRSAALIALWKQEAREREQISRRVQQNIDRLAASGTRTSGAGLAGIGTQVGTALFGGLAIGAVVSQLKDATTELINFSGRIEQARIAFTTLTGSAEAATKHLKELQDFANTSPFQFEELISSSRRLQALGFTAEEVIPILKDIGNAVSAIGGTAETLDRVSLAIAQMQSKGKVATQELNQLAEAGIPAWKILEEQTGKTRAELVKLVEQGQIASDVYIAAFRKFSQNNYGDAMEKQSHTFLGAISTMKDAVLLAASAAFEPTFKQLSKDFDALATDIQNNGTEWQKWRQIIELAVEGLDFTVGNILRGIKSVMLDVAIAQQQLNDAVKWSRDNIPGFGQAQQSSGLIDTAIRAIIATSGQAPVNAGEPEGEFVSPGSSIPRGASGPTRAKSTAIPSALKRSGGVQTSGKSDAERELEKQLDYWHRLIAEGAELLDTLNGVDTTTKKYAVSVAIANGVLKTAGEQMQIDALNSAEMIDSTNKRIAALKVFTDFQKQQTEAMKELTAVQAGPIQQAENMIEALNKEGVYLDADTERTIRNTAATLQQAQTKERVIAALEELAGLPTPPELSGEEDPGAIGKGIEAQIGPPPQILAHIDALKMLGQVADQTFASMAQGLGGLIEQWVLYGTAGPNALRKMIAAVLAQAAAQAAVEAIMQLAFAWKEFALASASAAIFDVRGAALHTAAAGAHLTSAAVFGTVAGVAAVAGRVIAGNAFNQTTQGGSGGGATGGGSGGGASTPRTIETNRNTGSPTPQHLVVTIQPPQGWVGNEFRKDWELNGVTRLTVQTDRG